MSKLQNIVRQHAALSPRHFTPGTPIVIPGGRTTVNQINQALAKPPSWLQTHLNTVVGNVRQHTAERNAIILHELAEKRLKDANRPASQEKVAEYLKGYKQLLDSGFGIIDRTANADDFHNHLSPLNFQYGQSFKEQLSSHAEKLIPEFSSELSKWSVFTASVFGQSKLAFDEFRKVVLQQIEDDKFWQRALMFCARAAIGLVFGAFGMAFLGNLVSGYVADWMGKISEDDIFIFNKGGYKAGISSDAYWKTAVPDASKGLVGDLGGYVKDQLWEKATVEVAFESADAYAMLDNLEKSILKIFDHLQNAGKQDLFRKLEDFKGRFRKNVVWSLFFEQSKPGALFIDQALLRGLNQTSKIIANKSLESLQIVVGCPFNHIDPGLVRRTLEKVYWALYVKKRFEAPDAKKLGDPVINRLIELGIGQRRTNFQGFWNSSELVAQDQKTAQRMLSINSGDTMDSRRAARKALSSEEKEIRYGRWLNGEQNDKQVIQWAESFLGTNPIEGAFDLNANFCSQTASGRVDPQAWQELVDRYNAAQIHLRSGLGTV